MKRVMQQAMLRTTSCPKEVSSFNSFFYILASIAGVPVVFIEEWELIEVLILSLNLIWTQGKFSGLLFETNVLSSHVQLTRGYRQEFSPWGTWNKILKWKHIKKAYKHYNIETKVVSPGNHDSLKTERYIKTISDIIGKSLNGAGKDWPGYVMKACYSHNTTVSPLMGCSPYKMVFLKKPLEMSHLNWEPFENIPLTSEVRNM